MQVSYGKLTVNNGKEMGERRLPLQRDDGDWCLAAFMWLYAVSVFQSQKNSLLYDLRISRSPNF